MPATAMNTLNPRSAPLMVVAPELIHTRRQPAVPSTALRPHTDQASRDAVRSFIRPIVRSEARPEKGVTRTSRVGFLPLWTGAGLPVRLIPGLRDQAISEGAARQGGPSTRIPSGAT